MNQVWRRGILYVAATGIEGCWLYALMALLNKQVADEQISISGILLLYPVSFGLNKMLQKLRWPGFCLRIISWLLWVAGVLLIVKIQLFGGLAWADTTWLLAIPRAIAGVIYTFKPALLILLSAAVIWWLGRRLAYLRVSFATLVGEFQFGLFILVIILFIAAQLKVDLAHSVYLIAAFFLFSLLGISIAHALEGTSWLSGLYRGHWSGLLLLSIGLVLILGFLISLVVTPDLLHLLLAGLKWIWGLIVKAIAFLISLFPAPKSELAELPPPIPVPEIGPSQEFKLWTMPEVLRNGLRLGWTVLMASLLVFAMWRISSQIFKWLRRKLASPAGAEYEPLPGAFRADFLGLLKYLFFKMLGLRRLFQPKARAGPLLPEIVSVRQIYRQLLRWASAAGIARHVSQTPREYLYELAGKMPEAEGDLDLITQQYVRTRYGAWLPTEEDLHRLRQSWHHVKQCTLGDRRKV